MCPRAERSRVATRGDAAPEAVCGHAVDGGGGSPQHPPLPGTGWGHPAGQPGSAEEPGPSQLPFLLKFLGLRHQRGSPAGVGGGVGGRPEAGSQAREADTKGRAPEQGRVPTGAMCPRASPDPLWAKMGSLPVLPGGVSGEPACLVPQFPSLQKVGFELQADCWALCFTEGVRDGKGLAPGLPPVSGQADGDSVTLVPAPTFLTRCLECGRRVETRGPKPGGRVSGRLFFSLGLPLFPEPGMQSVLKQCLHIVGSRQMFADK